VHVTYLRGDECRPVRRQFYQGQVVKVGCFPPCHPCSSVLNFRPWLTNHIVPSVPDSPVWFCFSRGSLTMSEACSSRASMKGYFVSSAFNSACARNSTRPQRKTWYAACISRSHQPRIRNWFPAFEGVFWTWCLICGVNRPDLAKCSVAN